MKKRTRSILDEINSISNHNDRKYLVENTASNVIASAGNLIGLINETYEPEAANDLIKRLINSIRTQDATKFQRGIKRANINESKRHTGNKPEE